MVNESIKDKKVWYKVGSGVVFSLIFIVLGSSINDALQRTTIPSFENIVSKMIILLFLGLISGYNVATSLKKNNSAYYFYSGVLIPVFILVLIGLIVNQNNFSTLILCLGAIFPLLFIHSGLLEDNKKFVYLLEIFAKHIPNIGLLTIAFSEYSFPYIAISFNVDFTSNAMWFYSGAFLLSLVIRWILSWLEKEYFTPKTKNRSYLR